MSDDEGDPRRDTGSDPNLDSNRDPNSDEELDSLDDPAAEIDDPAAEIDDPAAEIDDPATEFDDPAAEIDDPFAELGAGVDERDTGGAESGSDADAGAHAADGSESSLPGHASDAGSGDPFDELGFPDAGREGTSDDAAGRGDPGDWDDEMDALDDAFEQMDVDGPTEEDVWESLDADAADAFGAAGIGGATSVPGGRDTEHVVSKRTYCQQCPHFTSPPEAACTHEGTTIVEAVGFDEFRVRNCPMVSEENPTFDGDS
jgi:hypothetical protein